MDNEMIERVAKAIFTKRYEANGTFQNLKWEDYKAKEFYLEDARQAIKAMREPTQNMMNAAIRKGVDCGFGCGYPEYQDVYKATIDAVIGE